MVQSFSECTHLQALGRGRLGALRPADGFGDVDGGHQGLVRFGQFRRWAGAVGHLQGGRLAASDKSGGKDDDQEVGWLEHAGFPMNACSYS